MGFTGTYSFTLFSPASLVFYSRFRKWASGNQGKAGKKDLSRFCSSPLSSLASCFPSLASPSSIALLTLGLGSSKQDSEAKPCRCRQTDTACGSKIFSEVWMLFPPCLKGALKSKVLLSDLNSLVSFLYEVRTL